MTKSVEYLLPINPHPWTTGSIYTGRKNGKTYGKMSPDATLVAYQEAVRDSLRDYAPGRPFSGPYSLSFGFSRQLEQFITVDDKHGQRNQADATNMQKATEDALQGLLIKNDRDVIHIESDNYEQATHTIPFVTIALKYECEWSERRFTDFDHDVMQQKIVHHITNYATVKDPGVWTP